MSREPSSRGFDCTRAFFLLFRSQVVKRREPEAKKEGTLSLPTSLSRGQKYLARASGRFDFFLFLLFCGRRGKRQALCSLCSFLKEEK
jgi:hypothetical protein